MNQWQEYVGRSRERSECVSPTDLLRLAALLDYPLPQRTAGAALPWPENTVPCYAHWLQGNPPARQSELGPDGHPQLGSFLPPVALPRRMWAGSRVQVLGDYQAGQPLLHRETITSIEHKSGRSGELVFVTLQHDYLSDNDLVLQEQQDIVYRDAAQAAQPTPEAIPEAQLLTLYDYNWCCTVHPDPTLLFRYSAATFNGHRIHYDRAYATGVEGYPGLVVHGPLTATLLIDLYQRHNPGRRPTAFDFRGLRPLFDTQPFYLMGKPCAGGAELWAVNCAGERAMQMNLSAC